MRFFWLTLLGGLQIADVVTTNITPELETNPVVKFLFRTLGELWWTPKAIIFCCLIALFIFAVRIPKTVTILVMTGYTVVVLINASNVIALYN